MSDTVVQASLAKVAFLIDDDLSRAVLEVVINRGARDGVTIGDRFLIYGEGPHVRDPDTGEDLGRIELVRGRGAVVHVQDHLATIRTTDRRRTMPTRRIVREGPGGASANFGLRLFGVAAGQVIEEEVAPESEKPFDGVRVGDLVKPI